MTGPLRHVGAFLLGAAVALASVVVHRDTLAGLPAGMALALATTFTVAWAFRCSAWPTLTATYSAGWIVLVAYVALGRPEGDFVLAADGYGYTLLGAGLALAVVAVASFAARYPESRRRAT